GSETELIGLTKEGAKQEELVIPAGVKIFGRVVDGFASESLKSVSFESDDDVDYGYLVAGSQTLEKIKLPEKLTKLGMHSNAPKLREIVIPADVRKIPYSCFDNDINLESVEIKGNLTGIDTMAFSGCRSLKNIKLPDSVTSIGTAAFQNCRSLGEITLPKGLKNLGEYVFTYCDKITVTVPEEMQLEKWDRAFSQPESSDVVPELKLTVRVKKGSWADRHFEEVFTARAVKEFY
ncbi:MAG: leucine-rich repeat domain-containing protein, partial [Oscillospiraceae bacterium]|nr:leucine-rich repeat domain-containing protein [Oscillospiraceae bacterium]